MASVTMASVIFFSPASCMRAQTMPGASVDPRPMLARENLRARLAKPAPQANGQPGVPAPPMALPVLTYDSPIAIHMNGEDVQLVPVPVAHTDGDTMVYFPTANVIMTGDFYRST